MPGVTKVEKDVKTYFNVYAIDKPENVYYFVKSFDNQMDAAKYMEYCGYKYDVEASFGTIRCKLVLQKITEQFV